ncbi:MAG: dockerin type I repeat-containing protein [Oscillospiraceae bacterium]|nr:dockerin type I repeat-containing protein [Oscillospiraceae bacterium]
MSTNKLTIKAIVVIVIAVFMLQIIAPMTTKAAGDITSNRYDIIDNLITKIESGTRLIKFVRGIMASSDSTYMIYDGNKVVYDPSKVVYDGNKIDYSQDGSDINWFTKLKTGMTLKVGNDTTYTMVVQGDVSGDGLLTALDLSQLKMHFVGLKTLQSPYSNAADINYDGQITAVDMSQLKTMLVNSSSISKQEIIDTMDIDNSSILITTITDTLYVDSDVIIIQEIINKMEEDGCSNTIVVNGDSIVLNGKTISVRNRNIDDVYEDIRTVLGYGDGYISIDDGNNNVTVYDGQYASISYNGNSIDVYGSYYDVSENGKNIHKDGCSNTVKIDGNYMVLNGQQVLVTGSTVDAVYSAVKSILGY